MVGKKKTFIENEKWGMEVNLYSVSFWNFHLLKQKHSFSSVHGEVERKKIEFVLLEYLQF